MTIKAVIFDIGGVVLFEPANEAREILCKKFNIDPVKFKEYAKKSIGMSHIGKLSGEDFFGGLVEEFNLKTNAEELMNEWIFARNKTCSWNSPILELIERIRGRYLLVSFTNSTFLNDLVETRKRVYTLFDLNLVSQERGLRKPDLQFYELLVAELKSRKIEPNEALLIDDRDENLKPAEMLGIRTLLFDDKVNIEEKIKEFEVNIQ